MTRSKKKKKAINLFDFCVVVGKYIFNGCQDIANVCILNINENMEIYVTHFQVIVKALPTVAIMGHCLVYFSAIHTKRFMVYFQFSAQRKIYEHMYEAYTVDGSILLHTFMSRFTFLCTVMSCFKALVLRE